MLTLPPKKNSSPEERWDWFMRHFTQRMKKALYREAYRITRDYEDAADVMQEAIIKGAMKCWQLKEEKRLLKWMFMIVRREAYARKSKISPQTLWYSLQLMTGAIGHQDSSEDEFFSDIEKRKLRRAIDRLESPSKEIVQMKATTDLKLSEIAEELHMNYHTVRSRYRRALMYLKQQLEDENDEEG